MSERRVVDYTIASATNAGCLIDQVKSLMERGWVPQGGVEAEAFGFFQAMVKFEDDFNRALRMSK